MRIRSANPSDALAIAALHTSSWRNTYKNALDPNYLKNIVPTEREAVWKHRFSSPRYNQCVLVAESQNQLVGFACAFFAEHAEWGTYLDNLHVSKPYQGKGIGTALLAKISEFCIDNAQHPGMYLLVNQDNLQAQQFYLRLGARNEKSGIWNAPDGSAVPTYYFRWDSVKDLASGPPRVQ